MYVYVNMYAIISDSNIFEIKERVIGRLDFKSKTT